MERGRNRLAVVLGTVAAVAMLLAAFVVVWLVPRDAGISNAGVQGNAGSGGASAGGRVVSGSDSSGQAAYAQVGGGSMAPLVDQPRISVRGTGIVTARPDMLNLQLGVQEQNASLETAQQNANSKMDSIMNALKAAGIAEQDISTAQYNVEPVINYRENQPPEVTGYRVTNILNVKLRDISNAGKVIDDLVKSGANSIYGMSFGFSDPTALMRQAREQAMNDAKVKAEQLASLGGVSLGAPIAIDEGFANVPPVVMNAAPEQMQRDAAMSTAIVPGQQEIRVELSVAYAIK
jgi:uncharacterized protein YggE